MAAVSIGDLKDRVVIQQNTTTADTQGGRASSWGTLATVWASVRGSAATESIAGAKVGSVGSYDVVMRYRADVTPLMRLSWTPYLGSAKTLQILGVQPAGRDRIALTCAEVI